MPVGVASLELCKQLYGLSAWVDTQNYWKSIISHDTKTWRDFRVVDFNNVEIPEAFGERTYPAYDLGYLLRKLPKGCAIKHSSTEKEFWFAEQDQDKAGWLKRGTGAETPEDAVCKLAIELFESELEL